MANGSKEKELPTDQQCPHCKKWFQPNGLEGGHKANCPEKPTEDTETEDTTDMPEESPVGEKEESDDKEETDDTIDTDQIICPECGNPDDGSEPEIYYADSILNRLRDNLDASDRKTLHEHELLCASCNTAFDE